MNIQHPTSNIQRPTSNVRARRTSGIGCRTLDVGCRLHIRLLDKIGSHPEQAPRGRRRGGAQSKDPVECKTDVRTPALLSRDASTAFRPRLCPRRNSAQHDLDFECKTSPPLLPGKVSGNRISMGCRMRRQKSSTRRAPLNSQPSTLSSFWPVVCFHDSCAHSSPASPAASPAGEESQEEPVFSRRSSSRDSVACRDREP